jgi:hypothetical protein
MKRFLLTLLSSLALAVPAFALVGGPWDNNIPGNTSTIDPTSFNGTYQGTIKGKNLAGVLIFGTSTVGTSVSGTATTTGSSVNVQGYSVAYFEGAIAIASVDVVADLAGRKLSGVVEGAGSRILSQTLVRPATSTTAEAAWEVYNNIYFTGYFGAKFADGWANTKFTGKGFLLVKKIDFDGFYQQLLTNPTTATPQIVTAPVTIKVAGVKSSDTATSYKVTFPDVTDPQIQQLY